MGKVVTFRKVRGTRSWANTVKFARLDGTLVAIARGIVSLNRAGQTVGAAGWSAFSDRCEEIGVVFPNRFYMSVLLGCLAK